ncbi:MAG: hypothetical protein Q8M16_14290 [Pirellulaceae bacterium]|nr:hypothetical protein [Pirellulaceae bacterium]
MRRMLALGFVALASVALCGCPEVKPAPTPVPDKEEVAKQVEKMKGEYEKAAEAGGQTIDAVDPKGVLDSAEKQDATPPK